MLHIRQFIQLLAHFLFAPSLGRKTGQALYARPAWDEFALQLEERVGNLGLDFVAHAGKSKEDSIEVSADVDVGIASRAKDTAAF